MYKYGVIIEHKGEIVSDFTILASDTKDALKCASFNKRLSNKRGRVRVRRIFAD